MADSPSTSPDSHRVIALDEIDSTNSEAMRLAAGGERGPVWITARRQSRGRGRSGRSWTSVDGNLYASLLTTLDAPATVAHQLSLVAGVAAIDAIAAGAGERGARVPGLRLKWPNDGLIGTAKVFGVLPECTTPAGGAGLTAVIGIGVNLAGCPELAGRATTSLAAHGLAIAPADMLAGLACAMDGWLARWHLGAGFADVRTAWLRHAGPTGAAMSIDPGGGAVTGAFAGLDDDGALLIAGEDGRIRRFTYGDVSLRGDPAGQQQQ